MTRIEHPYYLVALVAVILLSYIYFRSRSWQKRALQQFGERSLVEQVMPGRSRVRPLLKFIMLVFSLALIVVAISNVESNNAKRSVKHEGMDVALVLDVSNSMLAEDVKPNRLEAAKQFASQLIDHLPDARIALVTFAGAAVLQTPLTVDHSAAQLVLDNISTNDMPKQGTDFGTAIKEAVNALPENQGHYRVIVLVSDGEDHDKETKEILNQYIDEQIVIFTAGVGTQNGSTIPVNENGEVSMKQDAAGNLVITKFSPVELNEMAANHHGLFVQLGDSHALETVLKRLREISTNQFDEQILAEYDSLYRRFLIPALLLIVLDLFISNRNRFRMKSLFRSLKWSRS